MNETHELSITFHGDHVECKGCKVVDHLKSGNDDFYIVEYDHPIDEKKYSCHFDMREDIPNFATKEECYREAAKWFQERAKRFWEKLMAIDKIINLM